VEGESMKIQHVLREELREQSLLRTELHSIVEQEQEEGEKQRVLLQKESLERMRLSRVVARLQEERVIQQAGEKVVEVFKHQTQAQALNIQQL
jgi:hypothetical protein